MLRLRRQKERGQRLRRSLLGLALSVGEERNKVRCDGLRDCWSRSRRTDLRQLQRGHLGLLVLLLGGGGGVVQLMPHGPFPLQSP